MQERLFFDGPERGRKLSAYWTLLLLAAAIASAGVVADSTATVIGAMIVAPLMTPILGIVLAVTLADGPNLGRSILLVVTGAAAVVAVGFVFGLLAAIPVDADSSSQVAGRVDPRLIDLLAALATGAVGAFALVRSDVSDTLPGVAIAISLVPPLAVVGLTLEAGSEGQAVGALLLFGTNVGAILAMGLVVMGLYHVRNAMSGPAAVSRDRHRTAVVLVVGFVAGVAVLLAGSTARIVDARLQSASVTDVATRWAEEADWEVVTVDIRQGGILVRVVGAPPSPDPQALRQALDDAGLADTDVRLQLVPEVRIELPAGE